MSIIALAAGLLLPVGAARAATSQPMVVSAVPATATPNVNDGTVIAIAKAGSSIVLGGDFTSATSHGSTTAVPENYALAFDPQTGVINSSFTPTLDGGVYALQPGPTAGTVYLGGAFSTVDGVRKKGVALVSATTGALVPGFTPPVLNGAVNTLQLSGGRLFVGGTFTKAGTVAHGGLVSLNSTTGALDPYLSVQLAGHHNYTGQSGQAQAGIGPQAMSISPDGGRLVAIGNFTTADGLARDQIVMVDLTQSAATVDPNWQTAAYTARCFDNAFDTYMRGIDFSPDGSSFVVVATGGSGTNTDGTNSSCDTAASWTTTATGGNVRPDWIDYTGQDTLKTVAVTGTAVYVGGHQRWLNNSNGYDYAGEGAVPRPGLAALDPANGVPLAWNPGRNPRGAGADAMLATDQGLYVGSDTTYIGNRKYLRGRIAFFPVAGGTSPASTATASLPSYVYRAGAVGTAASSNVLYRVDAGGSALQSTDNGPDWAADTGGAPSPYHNGGSNAAGWSPVPAVDSTVPASTPRAVFDSERWSPSDNPAMNWSFPVAAGVPIEVRLYFANRCGCTSAPGSRVFNVAIDGSTVLDRYDIVSAVGDQTGTMRAFDSTSDGSVDIDFSHVVENPLIDGIEIVRTDTPAGGGSAATDLTYRAYDGTTAGANQTFNSDATWGSTRGAFMVGNTLYYGQTDGNLYQRSFNGTALGTAALVDPYDDPTWSGIQTGSGQTYRGAKPDFYSELQNVTGMFYLGGRVYYSQYGQSTLYSRYFTPDSGIVGSDEFTTDGADFSNIAGMFYSKGTIYYANRSDGTLHSLGFAQGQFGSDSTVSGPTIDGNDWRTHGMFLYGTPPPPNQPPSAAFSPTCTDLQCSFDASASSDPDGTITSYAWDFGDRTTGSGKTTTHTYAAAGTYTATLTVTDNSNTTSTTQRQVTVAAAQPPNASFTPSCTDLGCSFDASASSDPDGTITSYAWDFGDSTTGGGRTTTHTYAAAGTYTVTLVVTDDSNLTSTTQRQVTVTAPATTPIGFRGHGDTYATAKSVAVTVPPATVAGDGLLLAVSVNSTTATLATPAGWALVGSQTSSDMQTRLWQRVAAAGDGGSKVTVTLSANAKVDAHILAYSGTRATTPVASYAAAAETSSRTAHTTPTVAITGSGDLVVSYWADKGSTTTWTAPSGQTVRTTGTGGTVTGSVSSVLTDGGAPSNAGSVGGLTATANVASAKATMWTIVLAPGA